MILIIFLYENIACLCGMALVVASSRMSYSEKVGRLYTLVGIETALKHTRDLLDSWYVCSAFVSYNRRCIKGIYTMHTYIQRFCMYVCVCVCILVFIECICKNLELSPKMVHSSRRQKVCSAAFPRLFYC